MDVENLVNALSNVEITSLAERFQERKDRIYSGTTNELLAYHIERKNFTSFVYWYYGGPYNNILDASYRYEAGASLVLTFSLSFYKHETLKNNLFQNFYEYISKYN